MSVMIETPASPEVLYPESDGKPMADNTKQYEWIVTIKENLDALLPDAFVAGDLLWYPVRGNPKITQAPDVLVAFGRPKGHRGSYKQWEEDDTPPRVVFEILSPSNTPIEMARKEHFYQKHGVREYYMYDPDRNDLAGWHWADGQWRGIEFDREWTSPLLGIRFELKEDTLEVYRPDGGRFITFQELLAEREREHQRAEQEYQRAERLAEKLRELGVDPNQV